MMPDKMRICWNCGIETYEQCSCGVVCNYEVLLGIYKDLYNKHSLKEK